MIKAAKKLLRNWLKPKPLSRETIRTLARTRRQGATCKQIANLTGLPESRIAYHANRHNDKLRQRLGRILAAKKVADEWQKEWAKRQRELEREKPTIRQLYRAGVPVSEIQARYAIYMLSTSQINEMVSH